MEWIVLIAMALVLGAIAAVLIVPTLVEYVEEIVIEAPVERVYDNIRSQRDLMRWSAWPSVTRSQCATENQDGEIGARTVFFSKGKRFGHQEIVDLEPNRRVVLELKSKGPPQRPSLTFELLPVTADRTRVRLRFSNRISRPFNVLLRWFGIVRWTRSMHLRDLEGLKRYCEPPFLTYTGEPALAAGGSAQSAA